MFVLKELMFFVVVFGGVKEAVPLRAVRLTVHPPVGVRGQDLSLSCERDLQGAPLYTVKWYRGHHEFYRYSPGVTPKTLVFSLPGIYVDLHASNETQVVLRRLTLGLAGNFSCEVTTEAPSFAFEIASKYVDILALPEDPPLLLTDQREYAPGDTMRVNCSSAPSRPAANLTLMINDQPVTPSETRRLRQSDNGLQRTKIVVSTNTLTPDDFPEGRLRITCVAFVSKLYVERAQREFYMAGGGPRPERITIVSDGEPFRLDTSLAFLLSITLSKILFQAIFEYKDTVYCNIARKQTQSVITRNCMNSEN